ncbi:MAG: NAD(P)/FAD-dependent oxidoreductase [Planctomycetota bacterium]
MTVLCRAVTLSLDEGEGALRAVAARRLRIARRRIVSLRIVRKSLDSRRGRAPHFVYSIAIDLEPEVERALLARRHPPVEPYHAPEIPTIEALGGRERRPRPVVVGSGPAGLFAAWRLVAAGCPPIILERGPEVRERSRRWHRFIQGGEFDPESNLLFGEGGAGSYSDGKLYTRVSDARVHEILQALVGAGAPPEILYEAHPHLGSNRLPSIVRRFREGLVEGGAKLRFSTLLTGLVTEGGETGAGSGGRIAGVKTEPGGVIETDSLFLAPGHSARDTLRMLAAEGIACAPKPFQMGVRVEHPQKLIDTLQYGQSAGHPRLPPAEYRHVVKRGGGDLFSFCMCPGGEILPATEGAGYICVNGASRYQRRGPFANSGFVITLGVNSYPGAPDPLGGLRLQEEVESRAARAAGIPFAAPALLLPDLLAKRVSSSLPESSYPFPLVPLPFEEFLPPFVLDAVRDGLRRLSDRLPGFSTEEALVTGPESRSSSPVRILRDEESRESPSTPGLYPIGEGAGHAGGIVSAAIDGMRSAEAWIASQAALPSGA